MIFSQPILESQADSQTQAVYQDIKSKFGIEFVPNFFKTLANDYHLLLSTWHMVQEILIEDSYLSRLEKEIIFTAVAASKNCRYCKTAHLAFCKTLSIDSFLFSMLNSNNFNAIQPQDMRQLIIIANAIATNDYQKANMLLDEAVKSGCEKELLTDLVRITAMSIHCSTLADTMQVSIDEEFESILSS